MLWLYNLKKIENKSNINKNYKKMNPNAIPFKPSVSNQEIRLFEKTPSVIENLYFDNLEKEFVKNNPWIFTDEDTNNKNFTIQNKNNEKIHITFNS